MNRKQITWVRILCTVLLIIGTFAIGCSRLNQSSQHVQDGDQAKKQAQVLFIGNSYTFSNDFPEIFSELALAGGHNVSAEMLADGGWTLEDHAEANRTTEYLQQQTWDYVVLQEQSVHPADPINREQHMYPAVRLLKEGIDSVNADTIFFMTWGRQDGLEGYGNFGEMQAAIEEGYLNIADELNIMVSPVGIAWQNAIKRNSQIALWQSDGSHPSVEGTYLAACVFYAVIFQESPEGLSYMAGLQDDRGLFLQSIAAETVFEEIERWNIELEAHE